MVEKTVLEGITPPFVHMIRGKKCSRAVSRRVLLFTMKTLLIAAVCIAVLVVAIPLLRAEPLAVGTAAPEPEVVDQDGKPIDWAALHAKGWVLVYFYPKADTPGCTKEACSLRDAFADLTSHGVKVVGVSGDKPAEQKAFQEKYKLPFTLAADTDGKVMDAFGVPHMMSIAKRQSFLFKDGRLVWRDLSASTDKQAADVLAAVQAAGK
jgi:peroxiredoxin Q/BCP